MAPVVVRDIAPYTSTFATTDGATRRLSVTKSSPIKGQPVKARVSGARGDIKLLTPVSSWLMAFLAFGAFLVIKDRS